MDLFVTADRIRTMADAELGVTAVAIRDGGIAALGSREDVTAERTLRPQPTAHDTRATTDAMTRPLGDNA